LSGAHGLAVLGRARQSPDADRAGVAGRHRLGFAILQTYGLLLDSRAGIVIDPHTAKHHAPVPADVSALSIRQSRGPILRQPRLLAELIEGLPKRHIARIQGDQALFVLGLIAT